MGSSEDFCCTPFDASCLFHGEKEKKRIPDQLCGHNMHENIFTGVCTSNHGNCSRVDQILNSPLECEVIFHQTAAKADLPWLY